MTKVIVYHDFPDLFNLEFGGKLENLYIEVCKEKDEMLQNIEDAEILITFVCTREMLERAKKLKWVQVLSAGVDGLPLDYIRERGIILTNGRGIHKTHMSEYALWAMISLARNTHTMMRNQIEGKWTRRIFQSEINGSTVGILGLGSIGQEIARKASLLGMRVIGVKSNPQDVDYVDKVYGEDDMARVFEESDYVINLLPATKKTEKMIGREYFSLMKKTACFINIGRGTTVNEEELIGALQDKVFRAMVSDVFNEEPLPEDSPLWKMDNVILTPHICGASPKYNERSMEIIEHNLKAYLSGDEMVNIIDLERGY